jgi:glycosyltransferase involved in cell wall biosynthesis
MRVLVCASTFPLRPGDGLPRFVFDLCQALSAHCEVTALAPDADGAAAVERMDGVEVHRFRYFAPRRWQRLAYGHGIGDNLRASWLARLQPVPFVVCEALATRRLARRKGVDVVNSHWLLPQGLSAALARGRTPRFRHVVTLHGGDAYLLGRLPFARALARFVVGRADAVVAVSSNVRDQLDAVLGRPSGAILQPVGVHAERFRAPAAPLVESRFPEGYLLFVGRLVEVKGVDVLLRALPRLRARHPGLGLVVAGYGPQEPALRRISAELGLDEAVEFTGRLSHEEVAARLQQCRAAVVPSIVREDGREEGMPTVVLEALAAGTRVVASASGGMPDLLRDGENAWLARPGDPEHLADRILAALEVSDPDAVMLQARRAAEKLDWSAVAARYLSVFREIAAAR